MAPMTICLVNQKGGCGKSSCCFHLSGAFAERELRVLLIDADPQGSLSQGFFGSTLVEHFEAHETVAALFHDESGFVTPASLPVLTPFERVSIVTANQLLAPYNSPARESAGLNQYAFRELIDAIDGYDLVLVDCPPNIYLCSWNALLASDFVLIPVPPEDFGTQGLRVVHESIQSATRLNPRLRLLGHLVSRYDKRLLLHRAYEQKLRSLYGDALLSAVLPEASAFKVAIACRQPVNHYSPRSTAAGFVRLLADEILTRTTRVNVEQAVA